MTSSTHDGLIAMFRDNPDFLTEVLDENLGIPLPPFTDSVAGNCDLTEIVSTEYRADAVVTRYRDGEPVLAVIVEAQRKRDARKRETWPVYVATVHARLHCPVLLLVVCPNASVAAWSAEPIVIFEPGLTLRPIVFGPRQVPVITDTEQARQHPEMTVLSTISHAFKEPKAQADALMAALSAIEEINPERATEYSGLVATTVPPTTWHILEEIMTALAERGEGNAFTDVFVKVGARRGRIEGQARAVLRFLAARGIIVSPEARQRIEESTDPDELDTWTERAATVTSIDDLFTDA